MQRRRFASRHSRLGPPTSLNSMLCLDKVNFGNLKVSAWIRQSTPTWAVRNCGAGLSSLPALMCFTIVSVNRKIVSALGPFAGSTLYIYQCSVLTIQSILILTGRCSSCNRPLLDSAINAAYRHVQVHLAYPATFSPFSLSRSYPRCETSPWTRCFVSPPRDGASGAALPQYPNLIDHPLWQLSQGNRRCGAVAFNERN